LWQELRRRRVFRTAGLYIVGAWLVVQVADIAFPAWGLPETSLRYLFIAAAACFPVALVFGWFFDVTPGGIVRTQPAGAGAAPDLRLRRGDYVLLLALLAIGATVLIGTLGGIDEEVGSTTGVVAIDKPAHSVAVLPFRNLDPNAETGFFSDGITEEVLHRLSSIGVLHVLASNSSFLFRDSEEGPKSISDKLGVRYLLQGSVRRDADFVRVTARLVDETGFQVWSEIFDRELESIFVIQTEIASRVASHVVDEIVPPQELPAGRTTENMAAYTEYLRGRAYFDSRVAGWQAQAASSRDASRLPSFP
jgi:TolB-like protein